jgi:hypothetical protein
MDASGRIYYVKQSDKSISWLHPDDITAADAVSSSSEGGFMPALQQQRKSESESRPHSVKFNDENAQEGTRRLQYGGGTFGSGHRKNTCMPCDNPKETHLCHANIVFSYIRV